MVTTVDRLSKDDACRRIRECAANGGVQESKHFRDELMAEGLALPDALYAINHGSIYREAEFNPRVQEWNYRIEGTDPDGRYIGIVFSLKSDDRGFLITVFGISTK